MLEFFIYALLFSLMYSLFTVLFLKTFSSEDCLLEVHCKYSLFQICAVHPGEVSCIFDHLIS